MKIVEIFIHCEKKIFRVICKALAQSYIFFTEYGQNPSKIGHSTSQWAPQIIEEKQNQKVIFLILPSHVIFLSSVVRADGSYQKYTSIVKDLL